MATVLPELTDIPHRGVSHKSRSSMVDRVEASDGQDGFSVWTTTINPYFDIESVLDLSELNVPHVTAIGVVETVRPTGSDVGRVVLGYAVEDGISVIPTNSVSFLNNIILPQADTVRFWK